MILSSEHGPIPTATLKDILDDAADVPAALRLNPETREVLGAYLDAFGIRGDYEDRSFSGTSLLTRDPTFIGFERGYHGERNSQHVFEEHPAAVMIGYNAGREGCKKR